MKKLSVVVAVVLGVIGMIFGLTALAAVLNGWVLSIIWKWFFVPTLHLPSLSIPQAIGIALVVSFLTKQDIDCKKEEGSDGGGVDKNLCSSICSFVHRLDCYLVYITNYTRDLKCRGFLCTFYFFYE